MRLAFTLPHFWPKVTGPVRVVTALANEAVRAGHACLVVAPPQGLEARDAPPMALHPSVEVVRVPPAAVAPTLDRWQPTFVAAHLAWNDVTNAALRWSIRRGVPAALQPHGCLTAVSAMSHAWQRLPYRLYDVVRGAVVRHPGLRLIAMCRAEEEDLAELGWPGGRIARLYPGVDVDVPQAPRKVSGAPVVLTLANFGAFRDPRWVIGACGILRRRGVEVTLRVAGASMKQTWYNHGAPAESFQGAEFLGPIPPADVGALYAQAGLFCSPALYESFGLPNLEAAVAGLPIVTTDHGIARELDLEPAAGAIASAPTPEGVADALGRALADLDRLRQTAGERQKQLGDWFAWSRRAEAYLRFVETLEAPQDHLPTMVSNPFSDRRSPDLAANVP